MISRPSPRHRPAIWAMVVLAAAASTLAACGSDSEPAAEETTTSQAPASEVKIADAWARTSPSVATAGAAYFTITNAGEADDALLSAAVDPAVAASAEVHETVAAQEETTTTAMGGGMGDGMSDDMGGGMSDDMGGGMMTMREVDQIPVPAGESVALKPGSYHIMLLDLAAPLEVGSTVTITLTFEKAGEVVVQAQVRDAAP